MTSPISVRVQSLQRAHDEFVNAVNTSKTRLGHVESTISTLGVAWTGGAATTFGQSMNQWCEQFRNIIRQLDGMRGRLEEVSRQYDATSNRASEIAAGAATPHGLGI